MEATTTETADAIVAAANEVEEIAESLKAIRDATLELLNSGLTRDALVLLIRMKANVKRADVEDMLWAMSHLDDYLEKPGQKRRQLDMLEPK